MTDTFSKSERSRIMRAVKSVGTGPEMIVRRLVHGLGFRYRLHGADLPGKPDLVFRRLQKVIFVHGCFWHWHGCPRSRMPSDRNDYWTAKIGRNQVRDRKHLRDLRRAGWGVLVVWECQTRKDHIVRLTKRIQRFLEK